MASIDSIHAKQTISAVFVEWDKIIVHLFYNQINNVHNNF